MSFFLKNVIFYIFGYLLGIEICISSLMSTIQEKEFESLRSEILHWQDRKIKISNLSIALVTGYAGWMLSRDQATLSWLTVSLFPILVLSLALHLTKIYELFQIRLGAYLAVYHDCEWEKKIEQVPVKGKIFNVGYNKSYAILYLITAIFTMVALYQNYHAPAGGLVIIVFVLALCCFLSMFITLMAFNFTREKEICMERWKKLKEASENSMNTFSTPGQVITS